MYHFAGAHSNQYLVARQKDRCCVDGCADIWTVDTSGLRLCQRRADDRSEKRPARCDYAAPPELVDPSMLDAEPPVVKKSEGITTEP